MRSDDEKRILGLWPKYEDGSYVRLGDSYIDTDGDENEVMAIEFNDRCTDLVGLEGFHTGFDTLGERVKRPESAPIGSDGLPINEGDEVWDHITGEGPFTVFEIDVDEDRDSAEHLVWCSDVGPHGFKVWRIAGQMTHTKPELNDLWDRLYEDARQLDIDLSDTTDDYPRMSCCRNLVKRAKALAEKEAAR